MPTKQFDLMYNGIIMAGANTFSFYNVKDQSLIVAVPSSNDSNWLRSHDVSQHIAEKVSYSSNPHTKKELCRISDLQLSKLERKPRTFRKIISMALQKGAENDIVQKSSEYCLERPIVPSMDPLPVFW